MNTLIILFMLVLLFIVIGLWAENQEAYHKDYHRPLIKQCSYFMALTLFILCLCRSVIYLRSMPNEDISHSKYKIVTESAEIKVYYTDSYEILNNGAIKFIDENKKLVVSSAYTLEANEYYSK